MFWDERLESIAVLFPKQGDLIHVEVGQSALQLLNGLRKVELAQVLTFHLLEPIPHERQHLVDDGVRPVIHDVLKLREIDREECFVEARSTTPHALEDFFAAMMVAANSSASRSACERVQWRRWSGFR